MVERTIPATRRRARLSSAAEKKSRFAMEAGLLGRWLASCRIKPEDSSLSSFFICGCRPSLELAGTLVFNEQRLAQHQPMLAGLGRGGSPSAPLEWGGLKR